MPPTTAPAKEILPCFFQTFLFGLYLAAITSLIFFSKISCSAVFSLYSGENAGGRVSIGSLLYSTKAVIMQSYISFLALLSVSLGVLNLLPIPVLDGGHLMYYLVELLAGRPVPEKIQVVGYQLGLFVILGVMMLALYNDFSRL